MVRGSALFSPCELYRYDLTREWGSGPTVVWVMLNPSTADAEQDDPTIRRCIGFSKAWGYGSLVICNQWAWRSTDPKLLLKLGDPRGPRNAEVIASHIANAELAVAAWGANAGKMAKVGYSRLNVEGMAQRCGVRMSCLGLTKEGHPRHPLYVHRDQPLVAFP